MRAKLFCLVAGAIALTSGWAQAQVSGGARAVFAPRPPYPDSIRAAGVSGSGVFVFFVDRRTGAVRNVVTAISTGTRLFDESALATFIAWRFDPRTLPKGKTRDSKLRIPVTFKAAKDGGRLTYFPPNLS